MLPTVGCLSFPRQLLRRHQPNDCERERRHPWRSIVNDFYRNGSSYDPLGRGTLNGAKDRLTGGAKNTLCDRMLPWPRTPRVSPVVASHRTIRPLHIRLMEHHRLIPVRSDQSTSRKRQEAGST